MSSLPRRPARTWVTLTATGVVMALHSQPLWAQAPDSTLPIYIHTSATGRVEGLQNFVQLSVEACRAAKGLPLNAPVTLPSAATLAKLKVVESEEYFDRSQHARYQTQRRIAADPRSGSCELRLFIHRSAVAETMCANQVRGNTTLLGELMDYNQPAPPEVRVQAGQGSRAGCGRPARGYDTEGLPREDAGKGVQCVWQQDVMAKTMLSAGLKGAEGHKPGDKSADFCLFAKQPVYLHNGQRKLVVVKSSANTQEDVGDQLLGEATAYFNHQLDELTDNRPIPAGVFTEAEVRRFVSQPAIVGVEGR